MLNGEGETARACFSTWLGICLASENVSECGLAGPRRKPLSGCRALRQAGQYLCRPGRTRAAIIYDVQNAYHWRSDHRRAQTCPALSISFLCQLLFSANKIPPSRDKTHAFYRRWLIIPFTRTFDGVGNNPKPDKELRDKLKMELAGILNHALCGLERLVLNETFTQPKSVIEAKKAHIRSNDNVRVFLAECVIEDHLKTIEKQRFYAVYEKWCDAYGERAVKQKVLKDALKRVLPRIDETRPTPTSKWEWLGIRWSQDASAYF